MPNPINFPYFKRVISVLVICLFFVTSLNIPLGQGQDYHLPAPGVMVHLSPPFAPPILKGIKVHSENPFRFDFILDQGDSPSLIQRTGQGELKQEATKLVKYFLASITIPEKDLWVNLSPYEKDRIIPNSFGLTEMGRDLLAEDYMLKQITASLMYPEDEVGKKFWKRIYEEAAKKFGTTNIPVNTFNKVWIVPEKAVVYENAKAKAAYVVESKLKIMLEQDYLALQKQLSLTPSLTKEGESRGVFPLFYKEGTKGSSKDISALGLQIVREIVIPQLTTEVNENKNFVRLRQVCNSLILATWYKKKIRDSVFSQLYVDKSKVSGINIDDPKEKEKIYQRYLQAFKKGVYNYIKEEQDPATQTIVPRKYFSGGVQFTDLAMGQAFNVTTDDKALAQASLDYAQIVSVRLDRAMASGSSVVPSNIPLKPDSRRVLDNLGLSYEEFKKMIRARAAFEEKLMAQDPFIRLYIHSGRVKKRFAKTLRKKVNYLKEAGVKDYLMTALIYALQEHYGDLKRIDQKRFWEMAQEEDCFGQSLAQALSGARKLSLGAKGPYNLNEDIEGRVTRSLFADAPVLLRQAPHSEKYLMKTLREIAQKYDVRLSVFFSHPFVEERHLIGHKVVSGENVVYGYGFLTRKIMEAKKDPSHRYAVVVANAEALDPEVRLQLQELLNIGQMTHPQLGTLTLPENLKIIFTMHEGSKDISFSDRVIVKNISADPHYKPEELALLPPDVNEDNYKNFISIDQMADGRKVLVLPQARIVLGPALQNITKETLESRIYEETGLVLDFQTVRMLVAMQQAIDTREPILRIIGPTGLGKTFSARGFALLRGHSFLSNPVSQGMDINDLTGNFQVNAQGRWIFHSQTPFKQRLEEGGVVALSELNTLMDINERASLAWWLQQIVETPADKDGYRTIELQEVPVAPGQSPYVIKIHPKSLIVIDVNPASYTTRGSFPKVFEEMTPVLGVDSLFKGDKEQVKKRISQFTDMFLKMGWTKNGQIMAAGIADNVQRQEVTGVLIEAFYAVIHAYLEGEIRSREPFGFSVRELKRMSEDALWYLARGQGILSSRDQIRSAVARAVSHHLMARWPHAERDKVRDIVLKKCALSVPQTDIDSFLDEELLKFLRPVHLRVQSALNTRELLRGFLLSHPHVEAQFLNITKETDRSRLEGGHTPSFRGDTFEAGAGILGQLIEEATAHPDKEIIYVLENIHNLRPEEAVVLNEILQEGTLYIKGHDTKSRLPANAHILAISRTDSDIEWSEAEQARFVIMSVDTMPQGELEAENFKENLEEVLSAINPQVRAYLAPTLAAVIHEAQDLGRQEAAYKDRFSRVKYLRFYRRLKEALSAHGLGPLSLGDIKGLIEKELDNFWIGLPQEKADALREKRKYFFGMLEKIYPLETSVSVNVQSKNEQEVNLQQQADILRINILIATSNNERLDALNNLGGFLQEHQDRLTLKETDRDALKDGDVIKTALKTFEENLGSGASQVAYDEVGQKLFAGTGDGRVFECKDGKFQQLKGELGRGISRLVYDQASQRLFAGTEDGRVFEYEYKNGEFQQLGEKLDSGISQLVYDQTSKKLFVGIVDGRVFEHKDGKFQQLGEELGSSIWELVYDQASKKLFAGTAGGRVFECKDGKFQQLKGELGRGISRLVYDQASQRLFAGTEDGRVFEYEYKNGEFQQLGGKLGGGIWHLVYDQANQRLFAGTENGRFIALNLNAYGIVQGDKVYELSSGLENGREYLPQQVEIVHTAQDLTPHEASRQVLMLGHKILTAVEKTKRLEALNNLERFLQGYQDRLTLKGTNRDALKGGDVIKTALKTFEENLGSRVSQLVYDEVGQKLFVGTEDGRVFEYKNGEFQQLGEGLGVISQLVYDQASQRLFAETADGRVFEYKYKEEKFQQLGEGLGSGISRNLSASLTS